VADITKEIAIMKKCVSPFIVRYYGNYQHQGLLWVRLFHLILGESMVSGGHKFLKLGCPKFCQILTLPNLQPCLNASFPQNLDRYGVLLAWKLE